MHPAFSRHLFIDRIKKQSSRPIRAAFTEKDPDMAAQLIIFYRTDTSLPSSGTTSFFLNTPAFFRASPAFLHTYRGRLRQTSYKRFKNNAAYSHLGYNGVHQAFHKTPKTSKTNFIVPRNRCLVSYKKTKTLMQFFLPLFSRGFLTILKIKIRYGVFIDRGEIVFENTDCSRQYRLYRHANLRCCRTSWLPDRRINGAPKY